MIGISNTFFFKIIHASESIENKVVKISYLKTQYYRPLKNHHLVINKYVIDLINKN